MRDCLRELGHEGNHEIEKTDGLDEGETQNGVGEKLATESRVAGNTVDEGSEDETNTNTGTSQTNGGRAHTNVLGHLNQSVGHLGRVGTALDLESVAGDDLSALSGTRHGALGSGSNIDAGGRGQAGGDEAGGHCEGWRGEIEIWLKARY